MHNHCHLASDEEEFDLTTGEIEGLNAAEMVAKPVRCSGQIFDVKELVRGVRNRDITVPNFGANDPLVENAGFQRSSVWGKSQMDCSIEPLLPWYPIPGVFVVRQSDRRYLVVDGQQQLLTLRDFYDFTHGTRLFAVSSLDITSTSRRPNRVGSMNPRCVPSARTRDCSITTQAPASRIS